MKKNMDKNKTKKVVKKETKKIVKGKSKATAKPLSRAKPKAKTTVKVKKVVTKSKAKATAKKVVAKPKAKGTTKKIVTKPNTKSKFTPKTKTKVPAKTKISKAVAKSKILAAKTKIKPAVKKKIPAKTKSTPVKVKQLKSKSSEDYMNKKQVEHFRAALLTWKSQLMDEVDRTVHHMKEEVSNYPDPVDRASQEEEFSLELRARDRERKLLRKIEEALNRINDDDYGYCDDCGAEIGVKRLEVRPTATQCIECKTISEIREKQVGDGKVFD